MSEQMSLGLDGKTQQQLRAEMIVRAAKLGLRPAEKWEIDYLSPAELLVSDRGGPVFVRATPQPGGEQK